ncbi:MAG: hypothetical protein JW888_10630 [Pirellulales bacterium]|nr:hypothetical protein [Pirellulales bacterium]
MASPDSGRLCCLRCGKPIGQDLAARLQSDSAPDGDAQNEHGLEDVKPATDSSRRRPSGYDGWALDEDLKHIGRLLGGSRRSGTQPGSDAKLVERRFDAAHGTVAGYHYDGRSAKTASGNAHLGASVVGMIAWTMLTLGLMASACGGVLLGWSVVVRRDDLWTVGLPITVAGLLVLVVALVLQLDRLSGDNRQTAARLDQFGNRLLQLRRDATMSASHAHLAGGAFYAHLADGASPQLLLTDLKSQLEVLTQKLGQPESEPSEPAR